LLGLVFFRERLRPLQWIATAIALIGVLILTLASGSLPWISLGLALTFGFYGLLKKKLTLSALESLGAETLASAPIGIFLILFSFGGGNTVFFGSLGYLAKLPPQTWVLLALTGFVTALPLYCFAHGAKLLPLSTLGFTQFINPTLQFVLGRFIFKEDFPFHHFVAFIFIWTAVIVYIVALKQKKREK
jgi:chloramphenicol-sensitive protein RarD